MTLSETMLKLAESLADINGNHVVRGLLIELSDKVADLERERDDLSDEIKCMGEFD